MKNDFFGIFYSKNPMILRVIFQKHGFFNSLLAGEWGFYPYDKVGSTINSEVELREKVPTYYETKLKQNKSRLQELAGTNREKWLLIRERSWQREKPETNRKPAAEVSPQLVKKVHDFYEQLGRADVRAVEESDQAQQKIAEVETTGTGR